MTDLDKKLKDILDGCDDPLTNADWAIDEIKQAFQDAGYLSPQERVDWHQGHFTNDHMSGAEWYQKFELEIRTYDFTFDELNTILVAAMVASGLTETKEE